MLDPFTYALGALHASPLGLPAQLFPADGSSRINLRVIRSQATEDLPFGDTVVPVGTDIISVQRSDVAKPGAGDRLNLLDPDSGDVAESCMIMGQPRLDAEGVSWSCEIEPTA